MKTRIYVPWLCVLALAAPSARAEGVQSGSAQGPAFACGAPSALPEGSLALCALGGYPFIGATLRQGFGWLEIDGRARFDYSLPSVALEGVARIAAVRQAEWDLAPYLGVGALYDFGGTYLDGGNYEYGGLRFLVGVTGTYALQWNLRAVAQLEVPLDLAEAPSSTSWVQPMAGAGLEWALGPSVSLSALAHLGFIARQPPLVQSNAAFAWDAEIGLGYRVF